MSMYELTDYQGQKITVTEEQASKLAVKAKLIPVMVNGQIHYLNPSDIASIKPNGRLERIGSDRQIEAPDNRGKESKAKEKLRKQMKERKRNLAEDKSLD